MYLLIESYPVQYIVDRMEFLSPISFVLSYL